MKLKIENLHVTTFATAAAPVAQPAMAALTAGEDCFSYPRACPWTRPAVD